MPLNNPAVALFTTIFIAQIAMLILKGLNIVNNWLWVLAPLWVPYAVLILILIIILLYVLLIDIGSRIYGRISDWKESR